jgi:hypothetical protein
MNLSIADLPADIRRLIKEGQAIPAHPLALTAARSLDTRRQRALTRYYIDAGAGGLAVGVHTTQFAIRETGLYRPVLELARQSAEAWSDRPLVMIAALRNASEDELIDHCRRVAEKIPIFGFYLQRAVGGIPLSENFWRRFSQIENVIGIKIAPFDRYRTLDVVRGVVAAEAEERVTLYTGNDDHIVLDLLTPFVARRHDRDVTVRIKGGLLGHWSVWTKAAVDVFQRCKRAVETGAIPSGLLALDSKVTVCNQAVFDVANNFHGVIAGCHEVLRRQGLLEGIWCLDPNETLGIGQADEISRVCQDYPELTDDAFVAANLERWLD